jgi:hypothetical protein
MPTGFIGKTKNEVVLTSRAAPGKARSGVEVEILHQFYATASDMQPGLAKIEQSMPLEYVRAGMFPTGDIIRYPSARAIPNLGISPKGQGATIDGHNYIVVPSGASIVVEEVPQRRGGLNFVIDHRQNPSVIFRPGGMFGRDCLVAGEVGTPRTDEISLAIWKLFSKHFFREFVKIGIDRLGPEALRLLHAGTRLTPNATWSRVTDLNPQVQEAQRGAPP